PYSQSYHHANSSSSQFETAARQMKVSFMPNSSEQCNQNAANNAANTTNYHHHEVTNESTVSRPKRELPFGGSTDVRNIMMASQQYHKVNGVNSNKVPMPNHEEAEPL